MDGIVTTNKLPLVYWANEAPMQAQPLVQALEVHGYRVRVFSALSAFCLAYSQDEHPSAIVMDVTVSGSDTAYAQVVADLIELMEQEGTRLPVLFLSERAELDIQLMAYRVGVSRYLTKPVDAERLAELLDEFTERVPRRPYRVVAIGTDHLLRQPQVIELQQAGIEVYAVTNPLQSLNAVRSFAPDVLLLEDTLPGMSGVELANILRGQDAYAHLPIVFLTTEPHPQSEDPTLGEDDWLVAPLAQTRLLSIVTVRARRTRQMARAKEAAERANQAKSDFLSSMSHELRTPMNAILGFAQFLEIHGHLDDEQKESVSEILRAGRHLLGLINEVLDLAKIEAGRVTLSLESVALAALIEECIDLVYPLAAAHGILLRSGSLTGLAVRADRMKLKQVLINLFSNAVKYNLKGGSVHLGVQQAGPEHLRITVSDTGPGISPERMKLLFQPFNRLGAENTTIEGSGIGLTITRKLVELMDGRIGVDSQVGVGSTFWVELPADTEMGSAAFLAKEATTALGDVECCYSILYIEDNPANLRLVRQVFAQHPHLSLLTAQTPELGVEIAATQQPDLILLDINLPGIDGYQVLEILRADDQLRTIPVIAVTAYAMPHDIARGMSAGFVGYLTKPLDIGLLLKTVEHWIHHRDQDAAAPS